MRKGGRLLGPALAGTLVVLGESILTPPLWTPQPMTWRVSAVVILVAAFLLASRRRNWTGPTRATAFVGAPCLLLLAVLCWNAGAPFDSLCGTCIIEHEEEGPARRLVESFTWTSLAPSAMFVIGAAVHGLRGRH